jgi:two-component system cell cycle sensor histidine kinase/response regulator CckA
MRRKQHGLTHLEMPVSEASHPVRAFAGVLPSNGPFGTQSIGRVALSHTKSPSWIEGTPEGSAERIGVGNHTASATPAWPSDLFGQAEPAAAEQPPAHAKCKGRLFTTFGAGQTRSGDDVQAGPVADVATWLAGFKSVVRLAMPAKLALYVSVGAGIWPIAVERHRLSAVVFELAMNARDAMAGMGTVAIGARNMAADEPRMDGIPPGDNVVISVRSNRAGMSGDMLVRVAESFFEDMDIDECVGGAITMAGAFLEASGGAIVVRSVLEKITAVDVIVPRANMDADKQTSPDRTTNAPAARKVSPLVGEGCERGAPSSETLLMDANTDADTDADTDAETDRDLPRQDLDRKVRQDRNVRILVVDDDDAAREVAVDCLESLGYFVVSATTAQSAYDTVQSSHNIDLVISDVVMPDIDGVTLAGMLRACKPDLPVAFMTGHPRDFMLVGELVLAKPFTLRDLEGLVVRGLDRGGDRT